MGRARLNMFTTYRFKRTRVGTISKPTTPFGGSMVFKLSDIPSYTDFTALFDAYKLTGVSVKFIPRQTENATASDPGLFYYYPDYDDDTTPDSLDTVLQYQGVRSKRPIGRPFKIFIRPRHLTMVYDTAATTAYKQGRGGFMDAAYDDVPHYGIKYFWTGSNNGGQVLDYVVTYYFLMQQVR